MRCQNLVRYGVRRARPLARRAARTLRPLAVAMRARKPWVRLRCKLLGWKVLFIRASPGTQKFLGKQKDVRRRKPRTVRVGERRCQYAAVAERVARTCG